jgi:hypothetical protein
VNVPEGPCFPLPVSRIWHRSLSRTTARVRGKSASPPAGQGAGPIAGRESYLLHSANMALTALRVRGGPVEVNLRLTEWPLAGALFG